MRADQALTNRSNAGPSSSPQVDEHRLRSDGILTVAEINWCRNRGIALAFDPVQFGWVTLNCEDDVSRDSLPRSTVGQPAQIKIENSTGYRFRRWRSSDAADLARMMSSAKLWRYMPESFSGQIDTADAEQLIVLSNSAEHQYVRAVEHAGEVIGQVRLEFQDAPDAAPEISYWLDETHWGKGHGSAIVAKFTKDSFRDRPGLNRLIAKVHRENLVSARVLEKIGFRRCHLGTSEDVWMQFEILRSTLGIDAD